jgi:hypothetical protein
LAKKEEVGSIMRFSVRSTILPALLAVLLASLLSFAVATYIYYPWPEKLVIHSSLVALSFFIAVRRPGRQFRILLHLPREAVTLALVAGFAALIAASIIPIPWLALPLALMYAALVAGVSLTEALKLRGIFDDAVGFALFSFIIGSTYFGVIALGASLLLGFPANRYVALALVALHTFHLVSIYSKKARSQPIEITVKGDSLLFICIWLMLIYNFYSIYYPNDVYLPGEDMLRHYMWSVNLIRNPWKFLSLGPDNYLVFHAFEGGLMLLANCYDAPLLNSVLLPVALLSTLALAQLTANVAGNPATRNIALILPFVFSGLGWLYLLLSRPTSSAAYFTALVSGSEKVYRNLMYIPFPLMWPVPQPLSVAAFLLFLSLLLKMFKLRGALPGSAAAAGLLMFSMLSTHPPQGVMAAALLALLVLLWGRSLSSALKPISLGTAVGALAGSALNMASALLALQGTPSLQSLMLLRAATFFAPALAAVAALALSSFGVGLEPLFAGLASRLPMRAPITSALGTFLLILGVSVALDPSNTFATSRADPGWIVGLVPWFMYTVLLGAALPLGLRGYELLARERSKKTIVILVLLASLAVAAGRIIGFLNASGIDIGYWGEKRFILFIYIALAPPAAYALKRLARGRSLRVAILSLLLALLAVNAAVSASYWGITSERGRISDTEKTAFDKLGELLWANPNRWVLSPTLRSRDASAFAAPIYYVFADPSHVWRWQVPELSLAIFRARNLDPPYLYINWATDSRPARSGWIGRVLLPRLPKLFSVGSIDVYDAPSLAPPVPNGSVALAIPPVWDESVDEAYLLLSLAGVNFTSVLEIDPALYNYRVIVVPYDPLEETRIVTVDLLKTPVAFTSGAVQVNVDSVVLGDRSERLNNIVVWRNPFFLPPEAFNATIKFEIGEYNSKTLNYFYFIYDFRDAKNYKYVGVMFTGQSQMHVLNCSLTEGDVICSPPWPGVLIGSNVNVAGDHMMKVSFDAANRRLCLTFDSLRPACFTADYSGGPMGVRADRLWLVKVKGIVLEARERRFIDKKRLEAGNYTLLALKEGLNMTFEVMLGNTSINYIKFTRNESALSYSIKFISEILAKRGEKNVYFNPGKYYSEISYSNLASSKVVLCNLTIISPSVILIPSSLLKLYMPFDKLVVRDISYVVVMGSPGIPFRLFSDFAVLESGLGFYAIAEMSKLHVVSARVFIYFSNGSSLQLEGNMTLEGRFLALARRPVLTADQAAVKGVVGQSLLYPYMARDLFVRGNTTFMFLVGDSSLLYFAVNADRSKVSFISPLDIYSEWESVPLLVKHLPLSIVLTVLTIGGFKLAGLLKKSKKIKRIYEENI